MMAPPMPLCGAAAQNLAHSRFALSTSKVFMLIFLSFPLGQRLQHNAPQRREREIERETEQERTNQHTQVGGGARDAPQLEPPQTQRERERDTPTPTPRKDKRKLLPLAGTDTGKRGQGASRGRPWRESRTEMGRDQRRTDMLLWRPGWEL